METSTFLKSIVVKDFSGGWNPKWALNGTQLEDNQSPYMSNADYAARFAITKRRGYVRVGNTNAGVGACRSIWTLIKTDGSEILMKTYLTTAEYLLAGTWTAIPSIPVFTTGLKFDFYNANNIVHFCNGVDSFLTWDGSGAVVSYGGNPRGNIFAGAFVRLFVAGQSADLTRLNYSAPGSYVDFAGAGSGNTSFPAVIKSLTPFFDRSGNETLQVHLVNGDMYEFSFDSTGAVSKKRVRRNVGALTHRSSTQVENRNFILDQFSQVRSIGYEAYYADLRSDTRSVLLDTLMPTLTNTNACSTYNSRSYVLATQDPTGGSNNIWLIYDENYGSWRQYRGIGSAHFALYQGKVTFASSNDLNVYQMDSSKYTDNGAPIAFEYHTKDYDFGEPIDTKTARMVKIAGLVSAGAIITVKAYLDGDLSSALATWTIRGDGAYVRTGTTYPYGAGAYGTIPYAGYGGTTSTIPVNPFTGVLSLPPNHFQSIRFVFTNSQPDVDFVFTDIKMFVEKDAASRTPTNQFILTAS